jgi:hypothetical protein
MIAKKLHDIKEGAAKVGSTPNRTLSKLDKLDSLVSHEILDAESSSVSEKYFQNADGINRYKNETINFIAAQGNFINIVNKGEKINPHSIVRRYQISFKKGNSSWVIIFSNEGKILAINHM